MEKVHLFTSTGRFRSFQEMQAFVEKTYSDDGDAVDSPFSREVRLTNYEPTCIEAIHGGGVMTLERLLANVSYANQWLRQVDGGKTADAAICVFAPNRVARPKESSLEYIGAYEYEPK